MATNTTSAKQFGMPQDDPKCKLAIAQPDSDQNVPHVGVVGDPCTILLGGKDTAVHFCLIDMNEPPGGGPPPHGHDFEQTFTLIDRLAIRAKGISETFDIINIT
jgi:hypothetical protein